MADRKLFKGGPVTMRQGGIGPDDYLFRALPGGRWTYVVIRHKPEDGGRDAYDLDRRAVGTLQRHNERVCVPDLQNLLWNVTTPLERIQLAKGTQLVGCPIKVMGAAEFLEKATEYHRKKGM